MAQATQPHFTDKTLFVRDTAGRYHIAPTEWVVEECRRRLDQQLACEPLNDPKKAGDWCMSRLSPLEHEVFACMLLDNQHRVIEFVHMFRGTIDGASVHPREVVKAALNRNAAAVMLAHNHPSGNTEPSEADKAVTRILVKALATVEVKVLDHFVVGGGQWYSFAEHGLL